MTDLRESVARAIATSYGLDPDDIAPRSVICGPGNEHLQEWEAYAEQADAALRALAEAGPTEKMVEAAAQVMDPMAFSPAYIASARSNAETAQRNARTRARAAIAAAFKTMGR